MEKLLPRCFRALRGHKTRSRYGSPPSPRVSPSTTWEGSLFLNKGVSHRLEQPSAKQQQVLLRKGSRVSVLHKSSDKANLLEWLPHTDPFQAKREGAPWASLSRSFSRPFFFHPNEQKCLGRYGIRAGLVAPPTAF